MSLLTAAMALHHSPVRAPKPYLFAHSKLILPKTVRFATPTTKLYREVPKRLVVSANSFDKRSDEIGSALPSPEPRVRRHKISVSFGDECGMQPNIKAVGLKEALLTMVVSGIESVLHRVMEQLQKFVNVLKSYAKALISTFEDPEKILEQTMLEVTDELTKCRQATAQVLACHKQLENDYKAVQQASEELYREAQFTLGKCDKDLAGELMKMSKSCADDDSALKALFDQQKNHVDNFLSNTWEFESKIQESLSEFDALKARAQSAEFSSSTATFVQTEYD